MLEAKLEDITKRITDGKHGDCKPDDNSGYFFISCKDVHDGIIDYSNARQITEDDFIDTHRRTLLEPNDILITNSGTIGRMALVKDIPETYRTTFQKSVAIVKPDTAKVVPSYLYYRLMGCVNDFVNQSNGSAQKNLLLGTMRAFSVSFPEDKEIQKKLSGILETYDDLIENNQKQIKLLEEAAQRLYKEWFVNLRFPGHEHVDIVDGVPAGWNKKPLGKMFTVVRGRSYSSKELSEKDGLLMVNLSNIRPYGGYNRDQEKHYNGKVNEDQFVDAHDLLMGVTDMTQERRTVGRVAIVPNLHAKAMISMDLIKLVPVEGSPLFYYALLNYGGYSEVISRFANGTNVLHLRPEVLDLVDAVVPDTCLQEKFATIFENFQNRVDALQDEMILAAEARDRLLPKLMSGEIEV